MKEIQTIIDRMDPEEALTAMAAVARGLFPQVSEEARLEFVVGLVGEAGADKVASLVQL
ncbi:MAG: hypothetical protein KKG88_03680 [Proteobacteria bacterium]|jgi:hypothetical protein|nr:hypothetical protein [Pseudomonadota bacterium]MCG2824711.1 hypothetical protein [Desulfobulbaceae bacterium]MDP2002958.1 hypothetical protein [Desulfurivibrionaceae bacterium]MBU4229385.1 hypothetical protein [Pseudomonadota bacterium]MBU4408521.1 hypothetical protein [Pseudomonadota bacterium]